MVTKSRMSPFAKTKTQRKKKVEKPGSFESDSAQRKLFKKWFSLIDSANLSHKRVMLPMNNLRNQFFSSSELHGVLHGFIIFEVEWAHVRGINYINEILTDTSFSLETKFMKRCEFDSIEQAAGCISSWFFGTDAELQILKDHLYNSRRSSLMLKKNYRASIFLMVAKTVVMEILQEKIFPLRVSTGIPIYPFHVGIIKIPFLAPPPPALKRRKVISSDIRVDYSYEEKQCEFEDLLND